FSRCFDSDVTTKPPCDSAIEVTRCCASVGEATSIVMSALRMILRSAAAAVVWALSASLSEICCCVALVSVFASSSTYGFVVATCVAGACATELALCSVAQDIEKDIKASTRMMGDLMFSLHAISELRCLNVK